MGTQIVWAPIQPNIENSRTAFGSLWVLLVAVHGQKTDSNGRAKSFRMNGQFYVQFPVKRTLE
jgi:hypothetical protein